MSFRKMVEQSALSAAVEANPEQCEHPRTEIRARTIRGGSVQYVRQCLDCGEPLGNPLKQTGKAPAFDEELRNSWDERRKAMRESAKAETTQAWWDYYHVYMKSPEWFTLREKVLKRDGYLCRGCLEEKATQVHHASYRNFGKEFAFELVSLCHACHDRFHEDGE